MIKRALILSVLAATSALAQIATVPQLTISSITGGATLGYMSDDIDANEVALPENRLYADVATAWELGAYPPFWEEAQQLRTLDSDKTTTGDTTQYSFTLSHYARVCVWHADSEQTKPTWLTTTYLDTGENVFLNDQFVLGSGYCATLAPGSHNLGGNCQGSGCTGTPPMYVVSFVPSWKPDIVGVSNPPAGTPGSVRWEQPSYTFPENTTDNHVFIERYNGTSGGCQGNVSENTNPANVVLQTAFRTWQNGEAGGKRVTVDTAAVTGNQIATLLVAGANGCATGSPAEVTINITETGGGGPAPAQIYYIDCVNGSDGNSGLDTSNEWRSLARANNVQPHSTGNIEFRIDGPCVGQEIRPTVSGASSTRQKIYCTVGSANETWQGTPGVHQQRPIIGDSGINWIAIGYGCSTTGRIVLDGQCTAHFGGPATGCNIYKGYDIDGDNWSLDFDMINMEGWDIGRTLNGDRLRVQNNFVNHGTPCYDADCTSDFGDVAIFQSPGSSHLLSGGSTWRVMTHAGHVAPVHYEGQLLAWGIIYDNDWADYPGGEFNFNPHPGGRGPVVGIYSDFSHFHDFIFNRGGKSGDQPWTECAKLEGTRNTYSNFVMRNCHGHSVLSEMASWSKHGRGLHMAHFVADGAAGPFLRASDYGDGDSPIGIINIKNGIIRRHATNAGTFPQCCGGSYNWRGDYFTFSMPSGTNWQSLIFVSGLTLQVDPTVSAPTGVANCDDAYVGSAGGMPKNTVTWYMTNFPANFNNITCVADDNLDNMPALSVDLTGSTYLNAVTPVSDTFSIAQGVDLTTATEASSGSDTTLPVANAVWFPDPNGWGNPQVGQWATAGCYQIHIEGAGNVCYTDVSLNGAYPNLSGVITLSTGKTWSNGAAVNYGISSGGVNDTPNRGLKR